MTKPAWLVEAEKDVGYREKAGNDNKFGRALGMNKVPWCDLAVTRWCQKSGHPLPSMQPGVTTGAASVWYSMRYAQANGLWIPSWDAKPGDQIVYGWQGPGSPPAEMHTGVVVSSGVRGSTGHTVEGNRGDQVGRFTFTVGEDVVLGCIDLNRLLLGRPKVIVTPKPDPQPRNPAHPAHTGPTPKPKPAPAPTHHKPATEAQAMKALSRYAKAHVALLGALGTWLSVALKDGHITGVEWYGLLVAAATGLGVYAVPNKRKATKRTATDRGHFDVVGLLVAALVILVLLVILVPVLRHR